MMDTMERFTSDLEKQEWLYKNYNLFNKLVYGKIKSPRKARYVSRLIKGFSKRYDMTKAEIFILLFNHYMETGYYWKFKSHPDALIYFIIEYFIERLGQLKNQLDKKRIAESTDRIYTAFSERPYEQEILYHAFVCFQLALSNYGKLSINRSIREKVKSLKKKYDIYPDEILSELFEEFLGKKVHLRYDPSRASLRTFILHHINYRLSNKIRNMKKFDKEINVKNFDYDVMSRAKVKDFNYDAMSRAEMKDLDFEAMSRAEMKDLDFDAMSRPKEKDFDDDAMSRAKGYSMSFIERLNESETYNSVTPEKILIEKELIDLIVKCLGEDDAKVFLGFESRKSQADRMGIHYDANCKRLRRKVLSKLIDFEDAGYC